MDSMVLRFLGALSLGGMLAAQTPAVDRGVTGAAPLLQKVERTRGFYGDSFRIGGAGETWIIERIRLWGAPAAGAACPRTLGDQMEKLTLLGALDNPPVPGQPLCDCHALTAIATAPLSPGTDTSSNPNVKLTAAKGLWQLDFGEVRWSVPGDTDVLFTVRATPRRQDVCRAGAEWKLAASPAADGHRLHILNAKGVPEGFAESKEAQRWIHIQVWGRKN